jgi:hypothetical protein
VPEPLAGVFAELILVENGSTDGTWELCRRLAARHPGQLRLVRLERGSYGEAIRAGMLACRGSHLSILECDVLDWDFVTRSVAIFERQPARLVIGSKRHPMSVDARPWKRRLLTAAYNRVFLRWMLGYPGTDTHGLKSLEAACARELCRRAVTGDEVLQTEIVLLAWRFGWPIEEIPVHIRETRPTPVSIRRRLPRVWRTAGELRRSLDRFAPGGDAASAAAAGDVLPEAAAGVTHGPGPS